MDLGGLEKHNFSTALLENSRNVTVWRGSPSILTRLLPLGPVFELVCHCPITALNSFKVELFVATPTTAKQVVIR